MDFGERRMPGKLFELVSTPLNLDAQAEKVYAAYPRHRGRGDALTAIRKALQEVGFEVIHAGVKEYADACRASGKEEQFIPYPAKWIRARSWEDDRRDWWRGAIDAQARAAYERLKKFVRRWGRNHFVEDPAFHRAKNTAIACPGGWTAFCDGRVTEAQFVAAWRDRERKTA